MGLNGAAPARRMCAALLLSWIGLPGAALAQGNLSARAQPVGSPRATLIGFGDQYLGGDKLYDARITVLNIVRGGPAWSAIHAASPANRPPKPGYEYLLARIRFEFSARTVPEDNAYTVDPGQFSALSSQGQPYPRAALAALPRPPLRSTLRSGGSAEGWVVFLAPRSDHTPLMLFTQNVGSDFHEGDGALFRLYGGSAPAEGRKAR